MVGPYQLQAAVAASHAEAKEPADTDWRQIAALYVELYRLNPSPVIALNHAVAVGMNEGFERGLELMDNLARELGQYHLLHAARADLLRRLGRRDEAATAYRRALALARNEVESNYLAKRLKEVAPVN
jgi:RNA polymerase sigma-70 factor (ECF subfamily)